MLFIFLSIQILYLCTVLLPPLQNKNLTDQRMSASMYEIFNWDGGKDSPRPKQMQLSLAGSSINIDDPIGEQIKLELLTFISLSLMFCIKNELCALHV